MPVFRNIDGKLTKLGVVFLDKEKTLQKLIEENLQEVLDMKCLASEYPTTFGGRIDTLAIDADGAPVIIEYKRSRNDNVINQALSYLKWLKSQKPEFFEMLVIKKLGQDKITKIDWHNPRVICIAENYSKFDIDTLEVIPLKLELYKFRYYDGNIFTLENVKGEEEKQDKYIVPTIAAEKPEHKSNIEALKDLSLEMHLSKAVPANRDLFLILRDKIFQLDENIQERINSNYIGYKVSKMFAEVHIQKNKLMLYLRPINYLDDVQDKIYKVPDSFNWVLNRRIYIESHNDLDYVMPLIEQSYKDVL